MPALPPAPARGDPPAADAADEETQLASHEKQSPRVSRAGEATAGRGAGSAARAAAAECAGAALLVLLLCLPCADPAPAPAPPPPPPPPLHAALAAGLTVALLVQCFDDESGALLSPAMTLAALVARRVSAARAALLVAAQLAGGAAGGLLLRALRPAAPALCVTRPAPHVSLAQAWGVECLLSACLALANCAAWEARAAGRRDSWPLRIGAVVAALVLAGGPLTGASMNPARSLGPALAAGTGSGSPGTGGGAWAAHWVYWAGPLSGALAGAVLHRRLWHQHQHQPSPTLAPPLTP